MLPSASLRIAQLGQPVLRDKATPFASEHEIRTEPVQQLIDAMITTLNQSGGIGLAAPQVFVSRRLFLACVGGDPRSAPPEVFINPEIVNLSDSAEAAWEGCLSFGELQVLVRRSTSVVLRYLNRDAQRCETEFCGLSARVVQHEYDHLEGVLTIDRALSTKDIIKASELSVVISDRTRDSLDRTWADFPK